MTSVFFRSITIVIFTLIVPYEINAQTNREEILFPIHPGVWQGANGSRWQTQLILRNSGMNPIVSSGGNVGISVLLYPGIVERHLGGSLDQSVPLVGIYSGELETLSLSLIVRETSRGNTTRGAEIPIVRERDLKTKPFDLLDVPLDPNFRVNLRVYNFPSDSTQQELTIRIYDQESELPPRFEQRLLAERRFSFSSAPRVWSLADLRQQLALPDSVKSIRIHSERTSGNGRQWAFVTITHNETQHVTVISPQ